MTYYHTDTNNAPQFLIDFEVETVTRYEGIAYVADSAGRIGVLDTSSGNIQDIVSTGVVFTDIAVNTSGELFGSNFSTLFKIDPQTGKTEKVGHFCQSGINGLGFTSQGELYASSYEGGVFKVNQQTGVATLIPGTESFHSGGDIAFDAINQQFFGVDTSGTLYTISLAGQLDLIGETHFDKVWGLYFESGQLYAQTEGKQQLLIDQSTGAATLLGNLTGQFGRLFGSTSEEVATVDTIGQISIEENLVSVINLNATDDSDKEGFGLSYSILGGEDAALFEIDASSGQLNFLNPPDFENPLDTGADNQYELQVGVTDSRGLTTSQWLQIRVTDVEENTAPLICEPGEGAEAYIKVRENQTFVTDYNAIDDTNTEGNGLTYSIVGGSDATLFQIDAATGVLSFKTAPDYENPIDSNTGGAIAGDNVYGVEVAVTDAAGLTDVQTLSVEVTDVDETPKDVILGDNRDNFINGTDGADNINGLAGNDTLYGRDGKDCIQGGIGDDKIGGNQGDDTLLGGAGQDTLYGHGGRDRIIAGSGNDEVNGGTGNDFINGSINLVSGANELDTLTGESGDDTFVLGSNQQAYYIANGTGDYATITDFKNGDDKVQLHGSQSDYSIQVIDGDSYLYYGGNQELIAVFEGIQGLDLHDTCFRYTDPSSVVAVSNSEALEGDAEIFRVELSHASTNRTSVKLELNNGSATLGEDFAALTEVSFDGGTTWKKTHLGKVSVAPGQIEFQVRVNTLEDALYEGNESFTLSAKTSTSSASGTGVILNDDRLQAQLVGQDSIHEGQSGFYRIDLSQASDVDRIFDIQIQDGSAHRYDGDGSNQDIIWGGYYDVRSTSTGEIVRVVENRVPNGTNPSLGDRPATGPGDASWDFTAYQDGTINAGNIIQVKVAAGQTQSDSFEIKAWKEKVTVDRDVQFATHQEGIESFNLQVVNPQGVDFNQDTLQVDIVDQTHYDYVSPLSIDLNGDGVKTLSIEQGIKFDILNTGEAINTGWISGEDGFLAVDANGNGQIDSVAELFGGGVGEGFSKLSSFDSNQDGMVNANDLAFDQLRIWQDMNENGLTDSGELMGLAQAGILGLSTSYDATFTADEHGNVLGERGTAIASNGQTLEMIDVYFKTASPV